MQLSQTKALLIEWDQSLTLRCNRVSRHRLLRGLFIGVSRLGDGLFWYALMLCLLAVFGAEAARGVLHMTVVGIASLLVYKWLKRQTARPRPFMRQAGIIPATAALDLYSFPSGHTLHAVSFTLVASVYFPYLQPALWLFTALVAISRPVLGLHYPSDVLAGACLGAGLASGSFLLL